jgi:2-isopropylmalate synthase
MSRFDHRKYRPYRPIALPDRTWPNAVIDHAPDWCSVDLRDGNQALIRPMSVEKKLEMFELLVEIGFCEIEIGFPSASQTEFEFARLLIDERRIPDGVTIQVLTQARPELIERTFAALEGIERAIVHVYNSTSTVQREQVFAATRAGIVEIAVNGATWVREHAARYPRTDWTFQYSPESFSGTESDFAVEVCNAVIHTWQPQGGQKVIINLPATVEMTTPNVFADQIEYFCRHVALREHIRVSLHTHNDRGCAVAASELGVMAGADRVEGTLFGNGERTGNMDISTMAMNLYSQGIDPQLDFSDITKIIDVYARCTEMPVHPRHPWAGDLVFAAFSGSHQDAIRKSTAFHRNRGQTHWNVAYLPIDPEDLGRRYEEVVRINSQSGKGGVALVLERDYGIELPKWLHPRVSRAVQRRAEEAGQEVLSREVRAIFESEFIDVPDGWQLGDYELQTRGRRTLGKFRLKTARGEIVLAGEGQGLIESLTDALRARFGVETAIAAFDEHALTPGTQAEALASVVVVVEGRESAACSIAEDSSFAVLQATLSAVGRVLGASSTEVLQEAV